MQIKINFTDVITVYCRKHLYNFSVQLRREVQLKCSFYSNKSFESESLEGLKGPDFFLGYNIYLC